MKYGAQVRDMHTAIHNVLIFNTRKQAVSALQELHATNSYPVYCDSLDCIEINFRNPPASYREENLTIVNGMYGLPAGIPNAY